LVLGNSPEPPGGSSGKGKASKRKNLETTRKDASLRSIYGKREVASEAFPQEKDCRGSSQETSPQRQHRLVSADRSKGGFWVEGLGQEGTLLLKGGNVKGIRRNSIEYTKKRKKTPLKKKGYKNLDGRETIRGY